ncbi:MAG: hypothetical protein WDN69_00880 [Aliidongia sp.]
MANELAAVPPRGRALNPLIGRSEGRDAQANEAAAAGVLSSIASPSAKLRTHEGPRVRGICPLSSIGTTLAVGYLCGKLCFTGIGIEIDRCHRSIFFGAMAASHRWGRCFQSRKTVIGIKVENGIEMDRR